MHDLAGQQTIVVGVDGSPSSDKAVGWAAREASMRNISLDIIHVIATPPWGLVGLSGGPLPPLAGNGDWREKDGADIISAAIRIAEESAPGLARAGIRAEMYFGATIPTLTDLSKDAKMIVVGSRGQGTVRRLLLGSVSTGLVHHAYCPVAVIHDVSPVNALSPAQLPVVVGIDGSPASELATAIAFDEASWRRVHLVALHSWCHGEVADVPSLEWSALQQVADEALSERLAGWRERYPDVAVQRRTVYANPARQLLEEAESAQLVVVGSHGRGGFSGMLLGSVSTAVVQAAGAPVIVARQR